MAGPHPEELELAAENVEYLAAVMERIHNVEDPAHIDDMRRFVRICRDVGHADRLIMLATIGAHYWIRRGRPYARVLRTGPALEYSRLKKEAMALTSKSEQEVMRLELGLRRGAFDRWYRLVKDDYTDICQIRGELADDDLRDKIIAIGDEMTARYRECLDTGNIPWLPPEPRFGPKGVIMDMWDKGR